MNRRGQIAIFVIVAIVIVSVILIFFLFPQANIFVSNDLNPSSYLRNCIEPAIDDILPIVSAQGGYAQPDNYLIHQGTKIQYLCYTAENYKTCKVQEPLLRKHVEEEINKFVKPRARKCMEDLKEEYEKRGFDVTTSPGEIEVNFILGSLNVDFISPMTVRKESAQTFEKFSVGIDSQMYDLIMISSNIIQFESTLGDSETNLYMQYYPDLKVEKTKKEGDTIYTVSNVITSESFTFASRSLVWPSGYGVGQL